MRDIVDEARSGGRSRLARPAANGNSSPAPVVTRFTRPELNEILNVYGRKVAAGEWRDYAIDQSTDRATFSVFRRTAEMPIFRIVKQPRMAKRQGAYSVITPTGLILKRGHQLAQVLKVIDPPLRVVA